jgi:hypothetical protein
MGLTPMSLFLTCALVMRNLPAADAFDQSQPDDERRAAASLIPRTRRRRTLVGLVGRPRETTPPSASPDGSGSDTSQLGTRMTLAQL